MVWKRAKAFFLESYIGDMEEGLKRFKKRGRLVRLAHWLRKADLDDNISEISEDIQGAKKELDELKKQDSK